MLNEDNNSGNWGERFEARHREKQYIYRYISSYIAINSFPIRNFAGNIVIKLSFAR